MTIKYPFKNLVFQGGGIKAFAYHGALHVLEEHNILAQVERVAGTSAGAMLATLLSFRLNVQEILELYKTVDFSSFLTFDGNQNTSQGNQNTKFLDRRMIQMPKKISKINRLFRRYSWYNNENLFQIIQEIISNFCNGNGRATFSNFQKQGFIDLHIVATNLSTQSAEIFSARTTPNVAVVDALLMSQSLPLYFEPVPFDGVKIGAGDLYADGGILMNYPLHLFDSPPYLNKQGRNSHPVNWETLGCRLYTPTDGAHQRKPITNLLGYLENLFETILEAQNVAYENNFVDQLRTINISSCGVLTADVHIHPNQEDPRYMELVNAGISATRDYLATYRFPTGNFPAINKFMSGLRLQWLDRHQYNEIYSRP